MGAALSCSSTFLGFVLLSIPILSHTFTVLSKLQLEKINSVDLALYLIRESKLTKL